MKNLWEKSAACPSEREARCQFFIVEPKGLKKARRAVTEMKREKEKAEEVKRRYIVILKSVNHHRINVVMTKRIGFEQGEARIGHAHGEMSEMINYEGEHNQPAHDHVPRCERRLDVFAFPVALGARPAILDGEADGDADVNDHSREKKCTNCPKQRPQIMEMLGIAVDPIRTQKNLEVAEQMSDHEQNQNHAGNSNDHLLSNRRTQEVRDESARRCDDADVWRSS